MVCQQSFPSQWVYIQGVSTEPFPVCGNGGYVKRKCQERRIIGATACRCIGDIVRDRIGVTEKSGGIAGSYREEGTQSKCKNRSHVCTRYVRAEADISDKKKRNLKQVETFEYLCSLISENGGGEEENEILKKM